MYAETVELISSSGICKTICIIIVVIDGYLERDNGKVFKFYINNSSHF